jgi:CHAT domain-containing protein
VGDLNLNARLVFLSACNTARSDLGTFYAGFRDLAASFMYAGVPTVLASLWSVETNSAQELSTRFFRGFSGETHLSASEALARAKRSYIAESAPEFAHPRFWSSIVLNGAGILKDR